MTKSEYSNGEEVFCQGEPCKKTIQLISGKVDLLAKVGGKYVKKGILSAKETFGTPETNYKFTGRANGDVKISFLELPKLYKEKDTFLTKLNRNDLFDNRQNKLPINYKRNTSLIRRLIDGLAPNHERINIRVSQLTGK